MALGQLPGDGVDHATMARTLDAVLKSWDWETKNLGLGLPDDRDDRGAPRRAGEGGQRAPEERTARTTATRPPATTSSAMIADLPAGNGSLLAAVA